MLNFPPLTHIFLFDIISFCIGSGILVVLFRQIGIPRYPDQIFRLSRFFPLFIGSLFVLVAILHGTFALYRVYSFRNLPISEISTLEIKKINGEFDTTKSAPIIFDNAPLIQQGLATLQTCGEFSRNHESFEDGYDIKLILKNESDQTDYHFIVFTKAKYSNNRRIIVIPNYGPSRSLNIGEYECASFHDWLTQHIIPLFENSTVDSN